MKLIFFFRFFIFNDPPGYAVYKDATIDRATAKRERARKPYVTENQNPTATLAKRPKTKQLLNMQIDRIPHHPHVVEQSEITTTNARNTISVKWKHFHEQMEVTSSK